MNNSLRKGLFLFAILLFPSLLYIVLSTGKHNIIALPYYGDELLQTDNLGAHYKVNSSKFLLAFNKSEDSLSNKILVINIVDKSCGSECDRVMGQLLSFTEKFAEYKDVWNQTLVLGSADSSSSIEQNFKGYLQDQDKWVLSYSENSDEMDDFVLDALLFRDSLENNNSLEPLLGKIVVLDKKRQIRAYFDGLQYTQYSKLVDAVKVLKAEEFVPRKRKK